DVGEGGGEGIEGDDTLRIGPLRVWADRLGGGRVGEIRSTRWIQRASGDRQRAINRVPSGVAADDVALRGARGSRDDGAAREGCLGGPADGQRPWSVTGRVRRQLDV